MLGLLAVGACGAEESGNGDTPAGNSAPAGPGVDSLDPDVAALVLAYCQNTIDCVGSGVPEAEACADTFAARLDYCPEETLSYLNCGVSEGVRCECLDEICISQTRCSASNLNTCLSAKQPFADVEDGTIDSSGIECCMCAARELGSGGLILSEEECWCYTDAVLQAQGARDCDDMVDTQSVCNRASCRGTTHSLVLSRKKSGVPVTYIDTAE